MHARITLTSFAAVLVAIGASAQSIDPTTLAWQTCGSCPGTAAVVAVGNRVWVGNPDAAESDSQESAYHSASALLPPADAYKIRFNYDLATWDSYNAPGTPNPPFNGGTGFWDSFSVSVSSTPLWTTGITDPYTTTKLRGYGFLWGGSSFGDADLQTTNGTRWVTVLGNKNESNYLNVALDTASSPAADNAYPSWGVFRVIEIIPTCALSVALNVPLYKQNDPAWGDDLLDHTSETMSAAGCAVTSAAMLLTYYGFATTPGELNQWLKGYFDDANGNGELDVGEDDYGFRGDGGIKWEAVAAFSCGGFCTSNILTFKGWAYDKAVLDAELCAGRPTILEVPGHFVVGTGKSDGSSPTYSINDPRYEWQSLEGYGNSFQSMRVFGPPGSGSIVFYYPPDARLLVADPLGRQVGTVSGLPVSEIAGAWDQLEEVDSDDENSSATLSQRILHIPDPAQGFYQVTVSSETVASGVVEISRYTREERPQTLVVHPFSVQPGVSLSFEVPYSTRAGDLNGDGFVDEADLLIVYKSLFTSHGFPGFNPVADANGDSSVDADDYQLVVKEIPDADLDGDGVYDATDNCLASEISSPLAIGNCNTGVNNQVFADGCTMGDAIKKCEREIRNHGDFVSCVAGVTNQWRKQSLLTGEQKSAMQSCAARSAIK